MVSVVLMLLLQNNQFFTSFFPLHLAGLGYRHLQTILLCSGLFMAYTLRVNISVGIVAMVDQSPNATHEVRELFIDIRIFLFSLCIDFIGYGMPAF